MGSAERSSYQPRGFPIERVKLDTAFLDMVRLGPGDLGGGADTTGNPADTVAGKICFKRHGRSSNDQNRRER